MTPTEKEEEEKKKAAKKAEGTRKYFSYVAYFMIVVGLFGKSWSVWTFGMILLVFSWMLGSRRP